MRLTVLVGAAALALVSFAVIAAEPTSATLTDAQKAAVEDVVRNLLTKKEPEILAKAAEALQSRQEAEAAVQSKAAIESNREKLLNDPRSPVGGNPKGDVTVVEFYDYQCGYCKMTQEAVQKLLAEDKNVKFIYKEFPILGANSVTAAKISIASVKQGADKFVKFHEALMNEKGHPGEAEILAIAKKTGLDAEKLKKDMADESVAKLISDNQALGKTIGARGTPTFIVGDNLFPGAVSYEQLKAAVDEARKGEKN